MIKVNTKINELFITNTLIDIKELLTKLVKQDKKSVKQDKKLKNYHIVRNPWTKDEIWTIYSNDDLSFKNLYDLGLGKKHSLGAISRMKHRVFNKPTEQSKKVQKWLHEFNN